MKATLISLYSKGVVSRKMLSGDVEIIPVQGQVRSACSCEVVTLSPVPSLMQLHDNTAVYEVFRAHFDHSEMRTSPTALIPVTLND